MGGAARNSGGTRGHGYMPLAGQKTNWNHHIVSDKTLVGLVTHTLKKKKLIPQPFSEKGTKNKAIRNDQKTTRQQDIDKNHFRITNNKNTQEKPIQHTKSEIKQQTDSAVETGKKTYSQLKSKQTDKKEANVNICKSDTGRIPTVEVGSHKGEVDDNDKSNNIVKSQQCNENLPTVSIEVPDTYKSTSVYTKEYVDIDKQVSCNQSQY